jgi:hypothetical protein
MVLVILLEEKLMSDYARKYPLTKKKCLICVEKYYVHEKFIGMILEKNQQVRYYILLKSFW